MLYISNDKPIKELREYIKVGMWATVCCYRDMFEITSEEVIGDLIDDVEMGYTVGMYDEINNLGRE